MSSLGLIPRLSKDFEKYTTVYLLKNKSDAFEKFQDFLKEVENQFSRKDRKSVV